MNGVMYISYHILINGWTYKLVYNSNNDRTSVYKNFEILKVIDKETFKVTDKIITEYPLNIFVNTFHYSTMMQ